MAGVAIEAEAGMFCCLFLAFSSCLQSASHEPPNVVVQVGAKLVVLNLSQQTDSSDLIGGFKPVEPRDALLPLLDTFQRLVRQTWSKGNNEDFLGRVNKYAQRQKWASLLKAFQTAVQKVSKTAPLCKYSGRH